METALSPLKKYRGKVILAPLLKLFECLTELATPFLVRYVIDDGIAEGDTGTILIFGAIIVALALVGFASTMVAQYLASRVASDYAYDLRKLLFSRSLAIGEKNLDGFSKGKVETLIGNDAFAMQNGVMMFMRLIFRPPFLLLGSLVLSFIISPYAGAIFAGAILLSAITMVAVMMLSPKRYRKIQSSLDDLTVVSGDDIRGRRQIKAFDTAALEKERYGKAAENYKAASMEMGKLNSFVNPLTFLFINAGIVLVVFLGGNYSGFGGLTSGEIASLVSYLVSSLAALVMWSRLVTSLNKALESRRRIDSFLKIDPIERGEDAKVEKGFEITFENVGYSYGGEGTPEAVSGLSFTLHEGMGIGLVGGTGSGKSTCGKLLAGLFAPTSGRILLNGEVVAENGNLRRDLRGIFAYVPQKTSLFSGTVKDNLLLVRDDATDEEMIEALKKARAYSFLLDKGEPLAVEVEEGGSNFSGGQRQRLALARAFLSKAPILFLDDSLSALDYLTEKQIREEIEKSFKTTFLISSRLSLVEPLDEILFFEGGRIAARGNHDYLLTNFEPYREFHEIQKGAVE